MALAIYRAPVAEATLERLLTVQQTRAIGHALAAIGKRKAEGLRRDVEHLLHHQSADVRRRSVLALVDLGADASVDSLRAAHAFLTG